MSRGIEGVSRLGLALSVIPLVWVLLANSYTFVLEPFFDSLTRISAYQVATSIFMYPFFYMSTWVEDILLMLEGVQFYILLRERYTATTDTWLFLAIILLDHIILVYPIIIFLALVPGSSTSVIAPQLYILDFLFLGNFRPFDEKVMYYTLWYPALLFQVQVLTTLFYHLIAKYSLSLFPVISVAALCSYGLEIILRLVSHFALSCNNSYVYPMITHNPLCAFHTFAVGVLVTYLVDPHRADFRMLNKLRLIPHGDAFHPHSVHTLNATSMHQMWSQSANPPQWESMQSARSLSRSPERQPMFYPTSYAPTVLSPTPITTVGRQTPHPSLHWQVQLAKPAEDPRDGIHPKALNGSYLLDSEGDEKEHRCSFFYPSHKDEKQWLSYKLYDLLVYKRELGDLICLMLLTCMYVSYVLLAIQLDCNTEGMGKILLASLCGHLIGPIFFAGIFYYTSLQTTIVMEWTLGHQGWFLLGGSSRSIFCLQGLTICSIQAFSRVVKVGPFSPILFVLLLIGTVITFVSIGTIFETLLQDIRNRLMLRLWLGFQRHQARLAARKYRERLYGFEPDPVGQ
ncbi:hypothetical protein GMRT_11713 [Giardia muris]|uniref:Uncharacterized protein n=1 Tax=Giardia muris TaxID=5742 RepID=A0A4Z1SM26_GIAMU|nr:hypothetical protein GMRT_11713 [Giardia muris]|eukprot:TNJ26722.1 hypothetical protein GMRT_11713 [Giardia muris]